MHFNSHSRERLFLFGSLLTMVLVAQESDVKALRIPGETQYDIAQGLFSKATYVGAFSLKSDAGNLARVGLGNARLGPDAYYKFFTTTVRLDEAATPFTIPDMLYPIARGTGPETYGARFIPVRPQTWDAVGNPVGNPAAGMNKVLRKFFYGSEDADKFIYVVLPHSSSHEVYFENFTDLASTKVETSTHHVSAYTSASHDSGQNTRRQLLDRGSINNVFAVSVKGIPQEAVNTNVGIWTKLYYQNPEGYQFSEEYRFDWVAGVNLEEVLAFGTAWVDHDWKRRDLNKRITDTAAALGRPKGAPLNDSYYKLLMEHKMLGIYCFEGVANMIYVGLNIPLTLPYFQRIWGRRRGAEMFKTVGNRYKEVQRAELQKTDKDGNLIPLTPEEEKQIEALDSPRIQAALSGMKGLWELDFGLKNPQQYALGATPDLDNPLYPDRNDDGIALAEASLPGTAGGPLLSRTIAADEALRAELGEFGKALPWKPQTTAEILRDLIYLYGPYHKVSAVRTTAVILTFQAEFYKRTGISKETFHEQAAKVLKKLFTHEANWKLAQLSAALLSNEDRALKFSEYKERTVGGVRKMMAGLKGADESRGLEEIDAMVRAGQFTKEEGEHIKSALIAFRRERNRAAAELGEKLLTSEIIPAIEAVYTEDAATRLRKPGSGAIAAYPAAGFASWNSFYADIKANLAEMNAIPVKEPDLVKQAILGQRFVKYNNRPGLPIVMAHGIHETHKLVNIYPVMTAINETFVQARSGPEADDPGFTQLQEDIAEFTKLSP